MKRSEMLAIIEDYLEKFDMGGSLSHLTYAESSNVLLCRLEVEGMLPPEIDGKYSNVPTVTPTGNLDYGYERGWESENV